MFRVGLFVKLLVLTLFLMGGPAHGQPPLPSHDNGGADYSPLDDEEHVFIVNGPWNDPQNWKGKRVPPAEAKVRVAAQANARNLSLRGNGRIVIEAGGEVHVSQNLNVANNSQVIIEKGGKLSVAGRVVGAAQKDGEASVIIHSDHQGSGSLIHNTPGLQARVERHVGGNSGDWHMLSAPVSGQSIQGQSENDFSAGGFYTWSEAMQHWVAYGSSLWGVVHQNRPDFLPGKGYMVAFNFKDAAKENNPVYAFEGPLHTGEMEMEIHAAAHQSDRYRGYNLLGNPYPSSLDWKAEEGWTGREHLETSADMPQGYTMWIWNQEAGQYGVQNSASLTDYVHNGVSRHIPPMQAFWVKANADIQSAVMFVDDRARVHSDQQWLKENTKAQGRYLQVKVEMEQARYTDEVMVEFGHPQARSGGRKMFSMHSQAPGLYVQDKEGQHSIYFMENPRAEMVIPLGFKAGMSSSYTIHIQGAGTLPYPIYLYDQLLGITKIILPGEEYNFTAHPGDDPNRFELRTGADQPTHAEEPAEGSARIYYAREVVHIVNPWQQDAQVEIINATGMLVDRFTTSPQSVYQRAFSHKPGVYIVRMISGNNAHVTRVVVGG